MPRGTAAALGAVVLLHLLATAPARAQGSIADPPAIFTRPVSSFDGSPVVHLTGVSSDPMDDHAFETGWWYRIAGDAAEKFFPAPNIQTYLGETSIITWNDVDGRGFRAVERAVLTAGGGPSGQVVFTLTLTNPSVTTPLSIDVFNMTDLDLGGTTQDDVAQLLNANDRIGIGDDESNDTAEYGAQGATAFLVLPYDGGSGLTDVAGRLNDAVVDNFDNSGIPFGPGDLSAGFQWPTTVIPPSGSVMFVAGIAVNTTLVLPPLPTTTTTTTSSTIIGGTTSTTLAAERCDDCTDDDGDSLVDFEDADCCAATPLTLGRSALRPREAGIATVKLRAKLAVSPLADGPEVTQDLTVQLRGGAGVLCARIPAANLVRRRKRVVFRDADGTVPSARGITAVTLVAKKEGANVAVFGREAQLAVLGPGPFTVALGFRDPATAEAANRCVSGSAAFRPAKRGIRYP